MNVKCVTCYRYEGVKHLEGRWYSCDFCCISKFVGRPTSDWLPMSEDASQESISTLIGYCNDIGLFEPEQLGPTVAMTWGEVTGPSGTSKNPIDLVDSETDSETEGPEAESDTEWIESDTEEYSQSPRDVSSF
jgi:hypothetical protein